MAKMWVYQHPNPPKVGDEVQIVEIEVADENVEALDGFAWPSAIF